MSFLSIFPSWFWWALAGATAFIVWVWILSDDIKKSLLSMFKKHWGVLFVAVAYIYMRAYSGSFGPDDTFNLKANTYGVMLLFLWGIAKNFLGLERYKSTQAIADNRSGSCAEYKEVGDYVVLNIGSCDAPLFPWSWGHETWVVPKRHFNKINNKATASRTQIKIKTNIQRSDLGEVGAKVKDFIEGDSGYNKENVFYGEFSRDEILSKPIFKDDELAKLNTSEYENKLKDTNRLLNEARAMLKGKTSAIKGFVSDADVIRKKAGGGSTIQSAPVEQNY